MKILNIQQTEKSPSVHFETDGNLVISGKCIMEHPEKLFKEIEESIKHIDGKKLHITFNLEYFNTSSARAIMRLLKYSIHFDTKISWVYEDDDEDMKEAGKDYEEIMSQYNMPFEFLSI